MFCFMMIMKKTKMIKIIMNIVIVKIIIKINQLKLLKKYQFNLKIKLISTIKLKWVFNLKIEIKMKEIKIMMIKQLYSSDNYLVMNAFT